MAPLNLSAGGSGTSMNALLDNLTKLNGTMAASESAAGATRAELGMQRALLPEAFITGVERDLVTAAAALQAAESAYSNGEKLRIEVESAGDRLVIAVEKITGLVDTAVQANQPDMRALTDILANLGTAYSKFTVVPSPSASAAETAAAASKSTDGAQSGRNGTASTLRLSAAEQAKASVTDARKAMLDQLATMNSHRRAVAAIVNVVAANTPFAALANCGVDTSALAAGIAFDPSGPITLVQGTAAQFGRTVVGGKAPYSVTMSQAPAGLSVRQSGAFEPAFEVHATAEVPVGSYNIVAADGAGHRAHLPVVVGPPPATNEKLKQRNDTTEAEQTRQMQRALCVPVDGVLGTETKQAFDAYGGLPAAAGKSKQDLKEELLNMRPDQIAARCTTPGGVAAGVQVTPTTALLTTIGGLIQDSSVEAKTAAGTARWFRIDKATVSGDGKRLVLHLTPGAGTGKPSLEEVRAAVNGLIIRQDKPAFDPSVIEIENWAALDLQP